MLTAEGSNKEMLNRHNNLLEAQSQPIERFLNRRSQVRFLPGALKLPPIAPVGGETRSEYASEPAPTAWGLQRCQAPRGLRQ